MKSLFFLLAIVMVPTVAMADIYLTTDDQAGDITYYSLEWNGVTTDVPATVSGIGYKLWWNVTMNGGLTDGTDYTARAKACNLLQCSEWSLPLVVVSPNAPTGLTLSEE